MRIFPDLFNLCDMVHSIFKCSLYMVSIAQSNIERSLSRVLAVVHSICMIYAPFFCGH